MRVQLHYLVATNISKIYRIKTDEIICKQHQPHFYSILSLSVEKRTVVGIISVDNIFNEQN